MNFCSACGAKVSLKIPVGDNLPRYVCVSCAAIHYQNPKVVVGCIPEWEDKILLCRRAIEPRRGLWTLPAGFMENNESTCQGAARETLEEASARVEIGPLYAVFSLPHISQVYLIFRGRLLDMDFAPGTESLEVGLFREPDIPWGEVAFKVVHDTLQRYYQDRRSGDYQLHVGELARPA
ncbi:MAG: NUDIX hydrolase [Burkholderiales bacterium]